MVGFGEVQQGNTTVGSTRDSIESGSSRSFTVLRFDGFDGSTGSTGSRESTVLRFDGSTGSGGSGSSTSSTV